MAIFLRPFSHRQVVEPSRIALSSRTHEHAVPAIRNQLDLSSPWSRNNGSRLRLREAHHLAVAPQRRCLQRSTIFASLPSIAPPPVDLASNLFTFGTAFVIPFYTVMILAPQAKWTKKIVKSSFPYVILGVLYAYLLSLSWSAETLQLMFASKYWLPELPGITRMFSSTMTVASAWIHLLAVDLFAGRQIYLDGLQHALETRHSLVLCLLFCPLGILSHYVTKVVVQLGRRISVKAETTGVASV